MAGGACARHQADEAKHEEKHFVTQIFGAGLPQPAVMLLAAISHLAYGGVWGALLAAFVRPVTLAKGLGLGVLLWLIMQIAVLPFLGWGLFGLSITPGIAVATLVLHLIYGGTLASLIDRSPCIDEENCHREDDSRPPD